MLQTREQIVTGGLVVGGLFGYREEGCSSVFNTGGKKNAIEWAFNYCPEQVSTATLPFSPKTSKACVTCHHTMATVYPD